MTLSKPMSKMLTFVSIFFIIVFGIYGVKKLVFMWFVARYSPPAATVSVTTAINKNWQSYLTSVSTLKAVNGVDLAAETGGVIDELRFNSGQYIKKGDVIIVIRSDIEKANLKNYQARLQLAKINFDREKSLLAKQVTAKATYDARYAELLQAEANVESTLAQIQQKTITAPFDGRLGISKVNVGELVTPGTTLVTLQALDPLYVLFNLPEQYLSDLYLGQDVEVSINYGAGKLVSGKITAIDSKVDPISRNVLVQATIPNQKYQLYPGMYGLAKIWLKNKTKAVVVPQTAISYSLSGDYVFTVDKNNIATRQYVKVGERRNDEAVILEGIQPGDKIVSSGQLKLQNGAHIAIEPPVGA